MYPPADVSGFTGITSAKICYPIQAFSIEHWSFMTMANKEVLDFLDEFKSELISKATGGDISSEE